MAQFRIYKPGEDASTPDSKREVYTGDQSGIDARKAAGEQFSYTKISDDSPATPTPPSPSTAGLGAAGGAMPPTPSSAPASASPAMASLMMQQPPPNDISQAGPSGIRQGLGTRTPPQYNYALASLQRGVY